jgi:nucleoside phosphorylase
MPLDSDNAAAPIRILLLTATEAEMSPLAKALTLRRHGSHRQGRCGAAQLIAAVIGMGRQAVHQHVPELLGRHQPRLIMLVGFSGGLDPALPAGRAFRAVQVINEAGERIDLAALGPSMTDTQSHRLAAGVVMSVDQPVCQVQEKQQLFQRYRASAADMETWPVAQLAMQHHTPLLVIRAICDPADAALPPQVAHWVDARGRPRWGPLLCFLLAQPGRIAALGRLYQQARLAGAALARAVEESLKQLDVAADPHRIGLRPSPKGFAP